MHFIFVVSPDVDDLYGSAFQQRPPGCRFASCADRRALPHFHKSEWNVITGHSATRLPVIAKNLSMRRTAEPSGSLKQCFKHTLQVERRAADDLEHIGGGGLLLQRFAQLVE